MQPQPLWPFPLIPPGRAAWGTAVEREVAWVEEEVEAGAVESAEVREVEAEVAAIASEAVEAEVEAIASVVAEEALEVCQAAEGERVGRRQLARSAPTIHPPQALAPAAAAVAVAVVGVLGVVDDLERDPTSVSVLPPRHVLEP